MFSFVCRTKGGFQVGLYLVMVALAKQHPPETFLYSLPAWIVGNTPKFQFKH
jgi:hypothetical protein